MLEAVQLGNCGLSVSRLALGTMNFGQPGRGHQGDWTLTLDEARPIFKAASITDCSPLSVLMFMGWGPARKALGPCCASWHHETSSCCRLRSLRQWGRVPTRSACRANM